MAKTSRSWRRVRMRPTRSCRLPLEGWHRCRRSAGPAAMQQLLARYKTTSFQAPGASNVERDANAALASQLADGVAGPRSCRRPSMAAKVASGALRADIVIEALTSSFLRSYERCMSNKKRRTTSAHIKQTAVQEALCTLGHGKDVQAILRRFCVNPDAVPRNKVLPNELAESYCAHRSAQLLQEAPAKCLTLHGDAVSGPWLIMDETVWAKNYCQITGLRDGGPCIVGGCWNEQPDLDYSCIPVTEEVNIQALPKERLAGLTQHFVMKRADNGRYILDLLCVPGSHTGSSRELLRLSGQVLQDRVGLHMLGGLGPVCLF